ncbi:MAG: NAD(P)H-dependent oxidoreductase subunit E [Acidobacteria bacterium]|nr:NAD(P)H-dependent oxidoreductase subunit E [Acidobacteriota bacterium]
MNTRKPVAGEQPAEGPLDVLIIDGEEAFAAACRRTLEHAGFRVATSGTAGQGLALAETRHPGVVLLALELPDMPGAEALGALSRQAPAAVPVVASAHGTVDAAVESMKLGAFDFLAKPVGAEKLVETVRRGLNLSVLRKEAAGPGAAGAQAPDKYDLLLQGLDVLGEAYSLGLEKRQLLDELTWLENEAKYHAESLGQIKKKERVILDIRNDLLESDVIMRRYDFHKNALIQVLLDVQEKFRWLPRHVLNWISGRLNIPVRDIYTIAHFYEAFSLEPRGRHIVQVCTGTACHVRGASELLTRISATLGVKPGETDARQAFTLETVHCIGCCALAPVVQIDSRYHRNPSKSQFEKIIQSLEKEEVDTCPA